MATLARWYPFSELADLRERLDRAFEDVANGGRGGWAPRMDLVEEDDRIVLRVDLPGVKAEDIDIDVQDDVLTVSGKHEESSEVEGERYVRRERRVGSFSRSIAMPKGADAGDVEATCENGVLEVVVPRPAAAESKAVKIKPKSKKS